jgi:hypothetical protein
VLTDAISLYTAVAVVGIVVAAVATATAVWHVVAGEG